MKFFLSLSSVSVTFCSGPSHNRLSMPVLPSKWQWFQQLRKAHFACILILLSLHWKHYTRYWVTQKLKTAITEGFFNHFYFGGTLHWWVWRLGFLLWFHCHWVKIIPNLSRLSESSVCHVMNTLVYKNGAILHQVHVLCAFLFQW